MKGAFIDLWSMKAPFMDHSTLVSGSSPADSEARVERIRGRLGRTS